MPNNSEVKLVQHVDDLTLFMLNIADIVAVLKLIKFFGSVSGSELNKKKSFIIQICSVNEAFFIEGIPVLKNTYATVLRGAREVKVFTGEFRKILGIYFCASVKHYVNKNWFEVYIKCNNVLGQWEQKRLSLIGKVLILNVKVIPKVFYILQSLEPMLNWQKRFASIFQKFIGGGSSSVSLSILEWGRDRGGLGLLSIWRKARSLRFNYLKSFLCRENFRDLSPINSIIGYYLDIPIISRYRPTMERTGQLCYGGERKVIDRGNMRRRIFSNIFWRM